MDNSTPGSKSRIIKSLYFYVVSFVALMMIVWSCANLINIALKTWVFTKADQYAYNSRLSCEGFAASPSMPVESKPVTTPTTPETTKENQIQECMKQNEINKQMEETNKIAQRQREVVQDISMIVVGIPLFFVHWRIVRRKDEDL
jgi:hypothetical protein